MDFSKIEAGKLEFEILDFDLRGAVEDSVELLANRALEKNIELASLIPCKFPTALRGDPGRLRHEGSRSKRVDARLMRKQAEGVDVE